MGATHVEVEAKYDLEPGDPVPDLVGVAGVTSVEVAPDQQLVAVYHDTADLRLTAGRTTLRRRTGGSDDGWHLKLPLRDGQRLEVHRAPGRATSTVPAALAALVRAHTGSAPLAAVATLTTTRRALALRDAAGRVVAEVADDTVRAERHGTEPVLSTWRELEVELVEGTQEQLAALDAAVRAAGVAPAAGASKVGRVLAAEVEVAPPPRLRRGSRLDEVLAAHLRSLLDALRAADPLVRTRVAGAAGELGRVVDRLAGTVAAFRHRLEPAAADALLEGAAPLRRALDAATAVETLTAGLPGALDREPPELVLGPVRRAVDRHLAARRRECWAALTRELDAPAYAAWLDDLAAWADGPPLADPREKAGSALPDVVRRSVAAARRRAAAAAEGHGRSGEEAAALVAATHRLAAAVGAAGPVLGSRLAPVEAVTAALAEEADALSASVVLREHLRLLAVQAGAAGGNGFTYGRLHARQERVGRRRARDVGRLATKLRRSLDG